MILRFSFFEADFQTLFGQAEILIIGPTKTVKPVAQGTAPSAQSALLIRHSTNTKSGLKDPAITARIHKPDAALSERRHFPAPTDIPSDCF
jgi:hypothetical protein